MDIKNHPFFKQIDWHLLEQKQAMPPSKPRLDDDLANFQADVHLTLEDECDGEKIDQSEFEGFKYVNPTYEN
jgi:atypical protein kinase C iota type